MFAAVALTLAAIGIYGVMAYTVGQRAREIGIRMALGATPQKVRRLVVWKGAALTSLGIASGTALALASGATSRSAIRVIPSIDLATSVLIILVVAATVLAGSWVPAVRASRVNPASTLRGE